MGKINIHLPVKLICAVTYFPSIQPDRFLKDLEDQFGEIDLQSTTFDFEFTRYYEKEMGNNLKKCYLSFKQLIVAEELPHIKISTNIIEKKYQQNEKRKINIDPGYIEKAKLILASTKDFSHRIYLGSGIFGDLQYRVKEGVFVPNEWTYPDYQEEDVKSFFMKVRNKYYQEVRQWQRNR